MFRNKKLLIGIAVGFALLLAAIGYFVVTPAMQVVSQAGGNVPAEQTQTPQQSAPAEEVKPIEEKPVEATQAEQKPSAPRGSTPKLQAQPVPRPSNEFQYASIFPTMPVVQGCIDPTEWRAQARIPSFSVMAKPGTVIQYKWELSGSTAGFEALLPVFGATKTITAGEGGTYIPGFEGLGRFDAFQVRVHITSPTDATSSWQQVKASRASCTYSD